ncbi:MAG TPA: hypothetical protein VFV24_08440, partial [Candidatus Eisenbacteria bacterium]|nr:hypothetical protein [Candidatus Eisenbacteria bacterium]
DGTRADPFGEWGSRQDLDQLADMAMRSVVVFVGMRMSVRLVNQRTGRFVTAVRKLDIDLGCPKPAAIHRLDRDPDLGQSESLGYAEQPLRRSARGHERPEKHVAADPRGRVQNSKASI